MIQVPLHASTFGAEEEQAAIEVLRSGALTMGTRCLDFEARFAKRIGAAHALFVNSGSSANLLATFAIANAEAPLRDGKRRLEAGAEVIVPAVTWSTTGWPIVQAGAIPVLVDSDPETLQLRTDLLEAAVGPRTVAIYPVHVLHPSVSMNPLLDVARRHRLWALEDTCEALGTASAGRIAGTSGDVDLGRFFFRRDF